MKRDALLNVVSRAFVKGFVTRVVMYFKNDNLHCDFLSDDGGIAGNILSKGFDGGNFIGDEKIGVADLKSFIDKLKTLGDDIAISIATEGRLSKVMVMVDTVNHMSIRHSLIADSQLPIVAKPKADMLSMTPARYLVGDTFISKFNQMASAIEDCKYMFVTSDGRILSLTLSQSQEFDTGVQIQCELETEGDSFPLHSFILKRVRSILTVNKPKKKRKGDVNESEFGVMKFHKTGMLNIEFNGDGVRRNYYLVTEL